MVRSTGYDGSTDRDEGRPVSDPTEQGAERPARSQRPGHPVIWGIVALVATAAVLGGVLGGGAFVASGALGLGDDAAEAAGEAAEETLTLPPVTETIRPTEPYASLTQPPTPTPTSTYSESEEPEPEEITLVAGQDTASTGEQIDLSGEYPEGDGVTLQVQRFEDGSWVDFPVDVPVNGGAFYTFITTERTGEQQFRLYDADADRASNEVTVTVG